MNNKLDKARVAFLSLCFVIMSLFRPASPVFASDSKIYPATFCQIYGPDLRTGMNDFVGYSQHGALVNLHPSRPLRVVCPIVRDNTQNTTGLDYVRVTIWNHHLTENFSCTLSSVRLNGENPIDAATRSAGHHLNPQMLNFQGDNGVNESIQYATGIQEGSFYTLFCSIPPMIGSGPPSRLGGYVVREPD
jgi:hypothetical protein